MRIGRWAQVLLAAAPLLAGCAGFWDAPSNSGGTTPTTLSSGNFYILNVGATSSSIVGYSIVSGTLTQMTGSPFAITGQAWSMAINPAGTYLYVSSSTGIYSYPITASTGVLGGATQLYGDLTALAIKVDPAGAWLLDASGLGSLYAIPITSSGILDTTRLVNSLPPSTTLSAATVQQMTITANGNLIAVALGSTGVELFPFNTALSGAGNSPIGTAYTNLITPSGTGGSSIAVAADPQNRMLYVGETAAFPSSTTGNSGGLRTFVIGSGSLTELKTGSPTASGGTGPHSILPLANGDYVYVGNWAGSSTGNITGFQVTSSGSTYALTLQTNTAATGTQPSGLAEDNKSNFVLAVSNGGSPQFDAYIFDTTTTGKLDASVTGSTGAGPIAVVAAP